ncbi:MAG: hypothetical protein HY598_03780 [Candidatus Omnitrophica bacterium]|nr:hypothetical protein [Candidatus Omnitrophota bacterium]
MAMLGGCLVVQWLLAQVLPCAWWVPDLLAVGLIAGVVRQPGRWLELSAAVGLGVMVWAIRHPALIALAYVGVGGLARAATRRWDLTDRRLQAELAFLAAALCAGLALWLEARWSAPVAWQWLLRAAATGLAAWVVSAPRAWRPWPRG